MTTTNHQALQLAAAQLVKAQEQVARLSHMGAYRGHELLSVFATLGDTLNDVGTALEAAGATYQPTDRPQVDPDGLWALRQIQTSGREARALHQVLGVALDCAEDLDKARGNWVGDMAHTDKGETPGTDYAEKVQALLLRLEMELGAEGGGRE